MGQKTHPIGIRLGINQKSCSEWYAENLDYTFRIQEDYYIRQHIFKTYKRCAISEVAIERRGSGIRIRISAANVRPLIGRREKNLMNLRFKLQGICQQFRKNYYHTQFNVPNKPSHLIEQKTYQSEIQVLVRQLRCPETSARYLAGFIIAELEKRVPFRRVLRLTQQQTQTINQIGGLRVQIAGRLNGAEIARTEWVRHGQVPLHTFSAKIDFACQVAHTIYGLLGVKVWIFLPTMRNHKVKILENLLFNNEPLQQKSSSFSFPYGLNYAKSKTY